MTLIRTISPRKISQNYLQYPFLSGALFSKISCSAFFFQIITIIIILILILARLISGRLFHLHYSSDSSNSAAFCTSTILSVLPRLIRSAQQAHDFIITSDLRRCYWMMSRRCQYDVSSASCACWAVIRPDSIRSGEFTTLMVTNEKQEIPLN